LVADGGEDSKPSGMEQATDKVPGSSNKQRRRGSTRSKLMINERRKVRVAAPPGSRFKPKLLHAKFARV
jgi:hypothetical protein